MQNRLIRYYLKDFSQVTGFTSTIKGFHMLWFDRLELKGVSVYDPVGNPMITAKEIMINFELSHLLANNDINIDGIFLDSAHVYLTKINDADTLRDLNINVLINRINENFASSSGQSGGRTPRVNIGEAFLNRSRFTYIDQDLDSIKEGFNYNQFSANIDEGHLRSFVVLGDTIEFDLRTLIAQDIETKFAIRQMSTFFRISQKSLEFTGLNLRAGQSTISDTVIFQYESQRDLSDIIDKVKIHANFNNAIIDPHDLALFAPGVERLRQPIKFTGVFNGRVNKFKVTNMDVRLGNTELLGALDMDGLPVINETFIILNLHNSKLDPRDLAFVLHENVLERLRPMGRVNMDGQFLGYPTDFVANGIFKGRLGTIQSDINFKVNETDIDRSEYSGKLLLSSFDLGTYLRDTATFGRVTLNGKVRGAGLSQETADFLLNGKINSIGIKGYDYKNIITDARFASGLVRGFVEIDDPNLQFRARGSVDLREGRNHIKVQARLDTAYLHRLNLSSDEVFLQTTLNADITGLTLDSLQGIADFNDFFIRYKDESLALNQIHINAQKNDVNRLLIFQSSLIDAEINGDYLLSNLTRDIQVLAHEISLNIKNDRKAIDEYYRHKTYRPQIYEASIDVRLKNVRPIAQLVNHNLDISPNTRITGKFTSGNTTIFNAYTFIDSLQYEGKMFLNTEAELTTSKITDSTSVLAMATINSANQIHSPTFKTKNLLIESIWNKNHIDFGLDADQDGQNNYIRLKGTADFLKDSTVLSLQPSTLKLLERDWSFADHNFIAVKGDDWQFGELALVNNEQRIGLNGILSKDPTKILTLEVDSLDMSLLNVLSNMKFAGTMNAQLDLSNVYDRPTFQNELSIKDLSISDFWVGDVSGKNQWDTAQHKFDINLFIDRNDKRIINVGGHYNPSQKESPLNLTAILATANLKILEPFLADIFSYIGGTVSGDFTITGKLEAPEINGEGRIDDGQLMVNYLKTMYRFKGVIGLTENSIYFKDIELTDAFRHTGHLKGAITHNGFSNMTIDLNADFRNFQVLNTSVKDNSLFYGQAYATGDLNFYGPISNLRISSTARTEKNTNIYIPIGGVSTVDKKEFITFVNFNDTTVTKKASLKANNKINLTGLTFDLNLDVTPDAYCEIIIDQKAGDIIRGRGNGDLKLQVDTKGEFNMFGPFEFTEGWYNFTLYDIINKEFEIQKGSRITWYGDPYLAELDIDASYNQLASLAPIINEAAAQNSPQLKRKYPVKVLLELEGPMLSPQINFDITAKDLPKSIAIEGSRAVNLDIEFAAFKNKLDEQELKRQVFSLIVLRRFSPPESFNTSGSVVNSVSELLSNQLSYWMSQVDQNLEIDVDLGTMDEEAFNTFQLRFSYTFLNGRLRVTGDGTFNNTTSANTANQPSPSSVAGDWTVDYQLTSDGKLRVKMYSRTNVNPILSSVNNQNTLTTGASIIHTQSFNEIRDLWRSTRKKKKEESTEFNKDALKEEEGSNE